MNQLLYFFADELIDHTNSGVEGWFSQNCTVIYLHALESGLFRIKVQQSTNRLNFLKNFIVILLLRRIF